MGELAKLLGKVAPWLVAAAGGPAGLATKAVATIAEKLGASDSTVESITQAVHGATPEQLQALKLADLDFKLRMQELGFKRETDLAGISAADRADARKNNVASGMQRPIFWLSVLLLAASLGSEVGVLFNGYPASIPDLVVGRVLGLLDAVAMMVLAYWYGTTSGSAQKTDLLAQAGPVK